MAKLILRKVTKDDREILFAWANEPEVRKNSFSTDAITWDEHIVWFERAMADPNKFLYILEVDERSAGMIRLDIEESSGVISAEVSYSIAAEYRGNGYGQKMIEMAEEDIKESGVKVDQFVAKVKPSNIGSVKTFQKLDYQEEYTKYVKAVQ